MAFFILFVVALGIGAVFYVKYRKRNVPIGHVGVLYFMQKRVLWGFDDGDCFLPPLCTLVPIDLRNQQVILPQEDTQAGDTYSIVNKGITIRYRVKRAILNDEQHDDRRFRLRILRRFIPLRLDSRMLKYFEIEPILHVQMQKVAPSRVNTFASTVSHDQLLGYHAGRAADDLMAGAALEVHSRNVAVEERRAELCKAITTSLHSELDDYGIEVLSVAIEDFAPSTRDLEHMQVIAQLVQDQRLEKVKTQVLADRFIVFATAMAKFKAEHPGEDPMPYFNGLRKFEVLEKSADKGTLDFLFQNLATIFMNQATRPAA